MLRAQDDITARGCVIKMFGDSWLSEQFELPAPCPHQLYEFGSAF